MLRLSYKASPAPRAPRRKLLVWRQSSISSRTLVTVSTLRSWDIEDFRRQAFVPGIPSILPRTESTTPPAVSKWFIHSQTSARTATSEPLELSEIDHSFWSQHANLTVPLEVTHTDAEDSGKTDFVRLDGPLSLLLTDLTNKKNDAIRGHSIYLAQHDLRDLPLDLQTDLPTPALVLGTGNGDLYSSSLWLGSPPTYTPLHKDPNPNILMQLAGTKVVRLFQPQIGHAIYEYAQQLIAQSQAEIASSVTRGGGSASFRGEEMMKGVERSTLHNLVWGGEGENQTNNHIMLQHAYDATLTTGQALFIPKGWWHSVKGLGIGVTASANWWFR